MSPLSTGRTRPVFVALDLVVSLALSRSVDVAATRARAEWAGASLRLWAVAFAPIQRIGGDTGWHIDDTLWELRGALDVLVGGPGLRRGRRHPVGVRVGDTIDFWRVEKFEQDRLLRLAGAMKLPGRAWLQFEVNPDSQGGSTITQTAIFDPAGVLGLAYWYSLWPIHDHIFGGMLQGIAAASATT